MNKKNQKLLLKAQKVYEILQELYPGSPKELCALKHKNAYELLVATILSAQCTDERVNMVMKDFVRRYPTVKDLADTDLIELEQVIKPTGFYKNKAKSLISAAQKVVADYNGEIPSELNELVKLNGVGRKTAQVVLSVFFNKPGLPVDTHVARLSKRIGLTLEDNPEKIENDLAQLFSPEKWGLLSLRLILHGRKVCKARNPQCGKCALFNYCDYVKVNPIN
jgi:endonuclease-3